MSKYLVVTERSYNGWPADEHLPTRPLVVAGVTLHIADNDDVETVFRYLAQQFNDTVEPLIPAQCGCFNYRENRNDPTELSNHSSATALDLNWLRHPNNTPTSRTFSPAQVKACHAILASIPELDEVVHWGGDWSAPLITDSMHWEIHDHDLAKLSRVADRIRNLQEDYMASDEAAQKLDQILRQTQAARKLAKANGEALADLMDAVESVEGLSEDIKKRVIRSRDAVLAALAEDDR